MAWKIDSPHTAVYFTARHMMIANVRGRFENISGYVDLNEEDLTNSSVEVTIDAASINTREVQRDAHLRSADFFDVEKYPLITFKSTRIEKVDEQHGIIHGDLTIKNITRPVALDTIYSGTAKSPFGHSSAGFSASTEINRRDWDLTWNVALETGGWLVSDTIRIDIELELIKEEEKVAEIA